MGYTTEFSGSFNVEPALTEAHAAYLTQFSNTRRMKRDGEKTEKMDDPIREAACLPVGPEGSFFVGSSGFMGQDHDKSVIEGNTPPVGQPGLWCQWVPAKDLSEIEWDGGEKFYHYKEWLEYIIENFLDPWGYVVNGQVNWRGEEIGDVGILSVEDNEVSEYDM